MIGMTKQEIDIFLTDNYKFLQTIAKGMAYKRRLKYDAAILITEAYEHCLKNAEKIQDENQLQRWFIAKMSFECNFSKSKTSTENTLQSMEFVSDCYDSDTELEYKLNSDLREIQAKGLIVSYHYKEKDPVKRIFFEAYFIKGHNTVRSIAKHFNLSNAIAHQYIKQMQLDVRTFAEKHNISFKNLN
jgi:hypothetical protein